MTGVQQRIRDARVRRNVIAAAAVLETGLFVIFGLAAGSFPVVMAVVAVVFASLALAQNGALRGMRAEARRVVPSLPAGFVPPSAALVSVPRPAVDVSMILDRDAAWNEACHYQDVTWKPDGIAAGVIRVIPRTAERPFWQVTGEPVITSWTVVTRAPSHGEGIDLLKATEPLLRERLAGLADGRVRYFRFIGARLAEVLNGPARDAEAGEKLPAYVVGVHPGAAAGPCAHPDAEPVDLITGERVAWVCPDCPADLPAGWTPPGAR